RPFRIDMHQGPTPNGGMRSTFQVHSRFTPDGKSVTIRTDSGLTLQDTMSERERASIMGNLGRPLAISPDARLVAASQYKPFDDPFNGYEVQSIVVAELATGKEVLRIETGLIRYLEFSSDGRYLATADKTAILVWDVATGGLLFRRAWPPEVAREWLWSPITSFAWGHVSRTAVTGMQDGTLLVWDLAPETWPRAAAATKLARKQLDRLWADLAGEDAARAHRAVGEFTAAPGASAAFLKEMLKPTAPPDKDQVSMLIANLDTNKSADRDAASK